MRSPEDKKPEVFGRSRVCVNCGKEFMPATFHAYVSYRVTGRKVYFCSYSCHNHYLEAKVAAREANRKRRRERRVVLQYTIDGEFIAAYESTRQAELECLRKGIVVSDTRIQRACRGENKGNIAGGFIWKYRDWRENNGNQ